MLGLKLLFTSKADERFALPGDVRSSASLLQVPRDGSIPQSVNCLSATYAWRSQCNNAETNGAEPQPSQGQAACANVDVSTLDMPSAATNHSATNNVADYFPRLPWMSGWLPGLAWSSGVSAATRLPTAGASTATRSSLHAMPSVNAIGATLSSFVRQPPPTACQALNASRSHAAALMPHAAAIASAIGAGVTHHFPAPSTAPQTASPCTSATVPAPPTPSASSHSYVLPVPHGNQHSNHTAHSALYTHQALPSVSAAAAACEAASTAAAGDLPCILWAPPPPTVYPRHQLCGGRACCLPGEEWRQQQHRHQPRQEQPVHQQRREEPRQELQQKASQGAPSPAPTAAAATSAAATSTAAPVASKQAANNWLFDLLSAPQRSEAPDETRDRDKGGVAGGMQPQEDPLSQGLLFQSALAARWGVRLPEGRGAAAGPGRLQHFRVERLLYRGYASGVYRASCLLSGADVVLKAYNLGSLSGFLRNQVLRELDIHSRLAHPGAVALLAAFREGDVLVLVQEYVRGGSLDRVRRKLGGRMTEFQAMHLVLLPLLGVLNYLHAKGIVHRDIKPENLLFSEDWQLKVCDYGVSICLAEERAVTRTGSREYMAPEVNVCPLKRGPEDNKDNPGLSYGAAADVWSLGALVYELLVGFTPFPGGPPARREGAGGSAAKALAYPGGVSAGARAFVQQCLELESADRPTVQQLLSHPWVQHALASRGKLG